MKLIEVKIRCLELAVEIGITRYLTENEMEQLADKYYKFLVGTEEADLLAELHEPLSVDTRY